MARLGSRPDTRRSRSVCRTARRRLVIVMVMLERVAPIFGVRDVGAALAYYERLGFKTRSYDEGIYGFATRDGIEFHLGSLAAGREWSRTTAYLYVDDADQLAAEWRAVGAEVHGPEDTDWGQHEGALVDLDGNVIRFGSPIRRGERP